MAKDKGISKKTERKMLRGEMSFKEKFGHHMEIEYRNTRTGLRQVNRISNWRDYLPVDGEEVEQCPQT